jgi:4-amino-4-deoxy-L-arabinose transferase-like glycosyltransferase
MIVRRQWRRVGHVVLAAAVAVAVVVPWLARNRALDYRGFSAIAAVNMYFYNAAAIEAKKEGKSYSDVQSALGYHDAQVYLRRHPEQGTWSPGRRFTYAGTEGARMVKENPVLYARLHVAGMIRVLLDPGALPVLEPYGLYAGNSGVLGVVITQGLLAGVRRILETNVIGFVVLAVFGIALVMVYGLAICGWLTDRHGSDPAIWLLVLTIAYFIAVAGGPVGVGRFRHPAMPFVCALAAMGVVWLERARSSRRASQITRNA